MDPWPRFAPLNAVLLGVLAIGASLPFVADDQSPLWSAPATGHAAATKFAVGFLCVALLWGAAAGTTRWQGLVQLVVAVLAAVAVVPGDELGSGGALIAMTAVLAAVVGIGAAAGGWVAARLTTGTAGGRP